MSCPCSQELGDLQEGGDQASCRSSSSASLPTSVNLSVNGFSLQYLLWKNIALYWACSNRFILKFVLTILNATATADPDLAAVSAA